ncbi:MAG TPA: F0F1 ATP synthase subunit epsilon [Bryobacteraceae bacterium]|nr:F0F1 ATP synthase subunit epsilon [Bryobacteraceae bacterium]
MADSLELEVATPERELVRERVSEVELRGKNGYMGILPGHAPLLGELGIGYLTYVAGRRRRTLAVHSGFVEVLDDHVRVLADAAERAEEIDLERARAALRRAREAVLNPPAGSDNHAALADLERAQARIEAAERKQSA